MKIALRTFWALLVGLLSLTACKDNETDSYDPEKQIVKDQAAIDEYIAEYNLTALEDTTSGYDLRYIMQWQGTGDSPTTDDIVYIDYNARLLNSSSLLADETGVYVDMSEVIDGWQILMPYLKEGGRITMFVPSVFAYGQQSSDDVPANSIMVYVVSLHEVLTEEEYENELIDTYISDNNLTVEEDSVYGLRYVIQEAGTGDYPTLSSTINVDYTAYDLDGDELGSATSYTNQLSNLIDGWQILMPYVSEGGTILMFLPTDYTNSSEPLMYQVTLNSVQ